MQILKWGNSLAARLLKKLLEALKLSPDNELGKVATSKRRVAVENIDKRAKFLRQMAAFRFPLPDGYKFDRDEANER